MDPQYIPLKVEQDEERDVYSEPLHNEIADANVWKLFWESIGISWENGIGLHLMRYINRNRQSTHVDDPVTDQKQLLNPEPSAMRLPVRQTSGFPVGKEEVVIDGCTGSLNSRTVQVSKGFQKYADESILHLNNKFIFLRMLVMVNFGNLYVILSGTMRPNLTLVAALYLVIFLCPLLVPSWAKAADVTLV